MPSFGDPNARLLIVGLAPGLRGANRTGRPFTGDYAGMMLYSTLLKFGFAAGEYGERADDGLATPGCMITNAVRCVPPANKPEGAEIRTCRPFLIEQINRLALLEVIVVLGRIAHESTLRCFELKLKDFPFGHGRSHIVPGRGIRIFDSYHCSRYNTNTGVLTTDMFEALFMQVRSYLDETGAALSGAQGK